MRPDQRKALVRIQVAAVVTLIAVIIAMNVVDRDFDIASWKVLAGGFGVMIALVVAATLAASRVEARPFRQLARESARSVVADIKNVPCRMRQRLNDTLGRPR